MRPKLLQSARKLTPIASALTLCLAFMVGVTPQLAGATSGTVTFTSNTTWTVPNGVTTVDVLVAGAGGGNGAQNGSAASPGSGGPGGLMHVSIAVTPGEQLYFGIGGAGQAGSGKKDDGGGGSGGWGGGGSGDTGSVTGGMGGGGGSGTYVQRSTSAGPGNSNVLAIAGGGGGGGGAGAFGNGGNGGTGAQGGDPGSGAGVGGGGGCCAYNSGWGGGGGNASSSSSAGGGGGGGGGQMAGAGGGGGSAGAGGGGGGGGANNYLKNDSSVARVSPDSSAGNVGGNGWVKVSYSQIFATTTAVAASPLSPVTGQAMTYHVQVTPQGTTTMPSGTVTLAIDGTLAGSQTLPSTGSLTFSPGGLSGGAHTVTATFAPAVPDDYAGSTGTSTVSVAKGATTMLLATTQSPTIVGQGATITASVSASAPATGTPTGAVQFAVDGTNLGSPQPLNASAQASISAATLGAGSHQVTAVYVGDASFNSSTGGPLTQVVNKAGTELGVTSSANPSLSGQTVTFIATAHATASALTPTGAVQFMADGAALGDPVPLNSSGMASISGTGLGIGSHSISATYAGNTSFEPATSNSITQVVNKGATSLQVTNPSGSSQAGQSVLLAATVSVGAPATGVPSGVVQFDVGGVPLGEPVAVVNGSASMTTSALPVGLNVVTARYVGDGNFTAATSGPVGFTVNPGVTSVDLRADSARVEPGKPLTLHAQVAVANPASGTPTGTVAFVANGVSLGEPVALGPDGTASMTTTMLPPGISTVMAAYSGDATLSSARSVPITVDVPLAPAPVKPKQSFDIDNSTTTNNWATTGTSAGAAHSIEPTQGATSLPTTGAKLGLLGILGMALCLSGAIFIVRRRRDASFTPAD